MFVFVSFCFVFVFFHCKWLTAVRMKQLKALKAKSAHKSAHHGSEHTHLTAARRALWQQRVYMEPARLAGHLERVQSGLRCGHARCCVLEVWECVPAGLRAAVLRLWQVRVLRRIAERVRQYVGPWGPVEPWAVGVCVNVTVLPPFEGCAEDAVDGEGAGELGPHPLLRGGEAGVLAQDVRALLLLGGPLGDALPPAAEHPVSEGVLALRVEHPVVVLAPGPGRVPQHFEEAVVEWQVVAHRVPPAGVAAAEKWELLHQVVVDLCQSEATAAGLPDGHGDERDVGVRGLGSAGVRLPLAAVAALGDRCRAVGHAVPVRPQLVPG